VVLWLEKWMLSDNKKDGDMSLINSNCGFTKLEEVWLGDVYPIEFYDHLPSAIKDGFQKITELTKQDLAPIEKKLQELGVTVRRPEYTSIDDCLNDNDNLLKPVIAARDDTLILGNTMYHLRNKFKKNPWQRYINEYRESGSTVIEEQEGPWACISPPCMVRIGQDLYIDWIYHQHVWGTITEPLVELAKDYRVHVSMIDGHSDCVFCPVSEGLILTTDYKQSYSKTFPGWEIYNINHANKAKPKNMGGNSYQWEIPDQGIAANKNFAAHIQNEAQHWIGSYIETVFDVNLLIIDDKNILSIGDDEDTFNFLAKKGYNVHAFDFKCRNFWDSGMHCLTNDIRRAGERIDYFPDRGAPRLDWLVDDNS
jgi:hypothetical protein